MTWWEKSRCHGCLRPFHLFIGILDPNMTFSPTSQAVFNFHFSSYHLLFKKELWTHEVDSVNRSQMDIKRKTCDIQNWNKIFISLHILHQHWYTCPIALPLRRNPQHISVLTVVSATSAPPFQPLRHQRNVCDSTVNRFTRQTLSTINRKHFFISFAQPFCQKNAQLNAALR
jgi:hypothetical protein